VHLAVECWVKYRTCSAVRGCCIIGEIDSSHHNFSYHKRAVVLVGQPCTPSCQSACDTVHQKTSCVVGNLFLEILLIVGTRNQEEKLFGFPGFVERANFES